MDYQKLVLGTIVIAAAMLVVAGLSELALPIQPSLGSSGSSSQTPAVNITLYAGEVSATAYGFGLSANGITSPGPTLNFTTGEVVEIRLVNVGTMPHAFEITDAPVTGASVLFNAAIGSGSDPISPGQSGSVIFTVTESGSFYYICPVSGHAGLGMWGNVTVG
jgi:uncharacterized cupredoxin-like copper-binding protein